MGRIDQKLRSFAEDPSLIGKVAVNRIQQLREIIFSSIDSSRIRKYVNAGERILFVDGGANIGQGFGWFSKYLTPGEVYFELFEPNPNCFKKLNSNLANIDDNSVRMFNSALWIQNGSTKFFGTDEEEGGAYALGGSINQDHNSLLYAAKQESAIEVTTIDFSEYLDEKLDEYDRILVKLDIEGAENDLLEYLISKGRHKMIDTIYIEFHSKYRQADERAAERLREQAIVRALKADKVKVRIWH